MQKSDRCGRKLLRLLGSSAINGHPERSASVTAQFHSRVAILGVALAGFWFAPTSAQIQLSGSVSDAETGEPLPAAHVRLLHTTRGTITGNGGDYVLAVPPGTHTVVVSMIGYRPDTARVYVDSPTVHRVSLHPAAIVLPEVVVSSEDPAVEIIRRAIRNKRRWIDRLASYRFEAFTRQVLHRDTAIASITESFTRGYWQQGDTLREIILHQRQTANIKQAFNFASVGRIINFNDDDIRFLGYTFMGPTHPEALDAYQYTLMRTRRDAGHTIFEIRMSPRSRTVPLFDGTVHIADETYALMGVDVVPNEAFLIPFLKDKHLRYRQQFALFGGDFWLPVDIRISGGATISVVGFTFPRIGFEQTSVITDYMINTPIPDSIFTKPRLTVDSTAVRHDSSFWAGAQVLPLSPAEQKAYASLDSTQTLEVQFRPGGAAMTLGGDLGPGGALLEYVDLTFNRVEGPYLGASAPAIPLHPVFSLSAGVGYGFASRRMSFALGGTFYTSPQHRLGLGAEGYNRCDTRPDADAYGRLVNGLTSLLFKNDYHDYYRSKGWRVFATVAPMAQLGVEIGFRNELHSTAVASTDYSIFNRSRSYRVNPPITEGMMRTLTLAVRLGDPPVPLDIIPRNALALSIEHASSSSLGGVFTFTRYEAAGTVVIPTFAPSFLFRPNVTVRVSAGASTGALPLQRSFSLKAASSGFAPANVFRALDVKEFGGDGYAAVQLEHNFRSLPFLALGIPFLYDKGIELILHGGVARTWSRGSLPLTSTPGLYAEAGFGVSRLFDLLRADCSWRLSAPTGFRFTLGIAQIL